MAGKIINKSINAYGNTINAIRYTPFYFTGGLILFITVSSSVTLLILAKVNKNKQKQVI